jgi:hypothetical protein
MQTVDNPTPPEGEDWVTPLDEQVVDAKDPKSGSVAEVSVQLGPNTYSPVKYNTFTVGPVRVVMQVGAGDDPVVVYKRAHKLALSMYVVEYESALIRYMADIRKASRTISSNAGLGGPDGK